MSNSRKGEKQIVLCLYTQKNNTKDDTWMQRHGNLKNIMPMLRVRSQTQKSTSYVIYMKFYTIMLAYGERNQKSGCLGLEVGQVLTGKRHEGAFWSDGNVLYLDGGMCGIGYTGGCVCQNS